MNSGDAIGGIFGLILGIIVLVISIVWIVFPFLVLSELRSIGKLLRDIRDGARTYADSAKAPLMTQIKEMERGTAEIEQTNRFLSEISEQLQASNAQAA